MNMCCVFSLLTVWGSSLLASTSGHVDRQGILGEKAHEVVSEFSFRPVDRQNCGVDEGIYWDCQLVDRFGNTITVFDDVVTGIRVVDSTPSASLLGVELDADMSFSYLLEFLNNHSSNEFTSIYLFSYEGEYIFTVHSSELSGLYCGLLESCVHSFIVNPDDLRFTYEVFAGED